MKKILIWLLALLLVLSLAACGGGGETPSGSTDPGTSQQEQMDKDNDTEDDSDGPVLTGDADDETKPDYGSGKWPEGELPDLVPAPGFEFGIAGNYETLFTIYYSDVSIEDLRTYAGQVEEGGFNVDPKLTDDGTIFTFNASNSDGYTVMIGKQMMEIAKPE